MASAQYRDDNFFFRPWKVYHEIIPHTPKSWQDNFGYFLHPLRNIERSLEHTSDSAPKVDEHGFKVCIDVHQFKPIEVTLRASNHFIVIEGKHEERQDEHGYIMRQFARRYRLPEGYDTKNVTCELSSDGILTIKAPNPVPLEENKKRIIHIRPTGLVHSLNEALKSPFEVKPIAVKILNQPTQIKV